MENSKRKLLEVLDSLEQTYYDCVDVFIKEIARNKESDDVKRILISFTDLITNIKLLRDDETD